MRNEEIYFSLGNNSFNYVVKSNPKLFDKITLAASLADLILNSQLENLDLQHIEIIQFCLNQPIDSLNTDTWFKIFVKIKEYLYVAICDQDLYAQALDILRVFYKTDQLKF